MAQIIDNKALLLRLRNPAPVVATIPESKRVDDNRVLVKWDVPQVHRLRSYNIEAPSPILGRYDWPGLHKPMGHQRDTAAFLTNHRRAFCFSEQGTGKTASAIWASDFLMKRGLVKRVLIVCPMSIMDAAWRQDMFKFAMHRSVDVAHGSADKRRKVLASGTEFVIINYDGLQIVEKEIHNGGFDLIIVDECSSYKNPSTKRWKTLSRLVSATDPWLWMMTGTPAAQSPMDAYGLARLVNPALVPRTKWAFRDQVMYKVTQFKWLPKKDAVDTVHRVLQPAIRFTKDECMDLPDMVYVSRTVDMSPQQRKYYDTLRKECLIQIENEDVTAVNAAVMMNKLLQVATGAVYSAKKNIVEFDIGKRYNVLREVIDEAAKKTLVFVPFKSGIEILQQKLEDDGVTTAVISGDVSARLRTERFNAFQTTDNPQVLLIQPQSAAHGVTLTAADTIVWWGPTPSLETYAQANARIHRHGQTHKCTVVRLAGSEVENKIYKMLDDKVDVHSQITSLYKNLLT